MLPPLILPFAMTGSKRAAGRAGGLPLKGLTAAVGHPPLRQDGIKTGVGQRRRLTRERVDGGVAAMLLLDLAVPLATEVQQDASDERDYSKHANNNTAGNGTGIRALLHFWWLRD